MSRDAERMWKLAGRYSAIGIEMVISVSMGTLGGVWLDRKLGTGPYLLLFGFVVGIGAAVLPIVRVLRKTHLRNL